MKKRLVSILSSVFCLSLIVAALVPLSASAATTTVYNNIPDPQPSNVPSVGYEATSTSEFGGQLGLSGSERENPKVTILMSSWGCQSGSWNHGNCVTAPGATFTHPVTLNIYNVNPDNSPGSLINSTTETFTMPYRPSADNTNCSGGTWYDGTECFNGKAFTINFDLSGVTLPDNVIVGVAYNTSHYGESPVGTAESCYGTEQGCPYDSLNVGTNPSPSVGTALPTENDAYLDSTWGGAYCDNGIGGTGTFRLDAGCWTGFLPAIKVETATPMPTNQNQCKKDGWKSFGTTFKNQGDCVSFVATKGKNQPSGN